MADYDSTSPYFTTGVHTVLSGCDEQSPHTQIAR